MTKTIIKSIWSIGLSIGMGLAVLIPSISASAQPASARFEPEKQLGLTSTCDFVNPNRLQCNFPAIKRTAQIQYVSMQCGSTGGQFSLQLFQFLATPPNNTTSELAYQIPISNQPSLGGVVSDGSLVSIYVAANLAPRALIDLIPAPSGSTQCTVSVSDITVSPTKTR